MDQILQTNPGRAYAARRDEIDAAVRRVCESGRYILGDEVAAFEQEFGHYIGTPACVGVANGTDALQLALRTFGIGPGDAVITAANTAVATVAAIELACARPVLCDVETSTLTLCPEDVRRVLDTELGAGVRAIIPVHLYGQPANIFELMGIARKRSLMIIEDCAQAHGAEIDGRKVGTFGDAAAFSFYPTKNLAAFGDAGALLTKETSAGIRARELRVYGWRERYISESAGMNTRLDEIQAAILRVRLRDLAAENARRREVAAIYDRRLAELELRLPSPPSGRQHVYHQYVIRTDGRDSLREHLRDRGIETAILYPVPIHEQPAYRERQLTNVPLPVSEAASRELLCLPMSPWLRDDEADRVCDVICEWSVAAR